MKILDKALEDVLFIRLVYLVWVVVFGVILYLATLESVAYVENAVLLVIPVFLSIVVLALLYFACIKEHKKPFHPDAVDYYFWIFFLASVFVALPLWLLLKGSGDDTEAKG